MAMEELRSASYRNERELQKTITTLNANLSTLANRTNLLTLDKEFEVEAAAKEAWRNKRHTSLLWLQEQLGLVRGLEAALAAEVEAKRASRPPF